MINQKPVTRDEMEFIRHTGDFVALADSQEGGWFDGFIEDCLTKLPKDLARVRLFFSSFFFLLTPHHNCYQYWGHTEIIFRTWRTRQIQWRVRALVLKIPHRHPCPPDSDRHHRYPTRCTHRNPVQSLGPIGSQDWIDRVFHASVQYRAWCIDESKKTWDVCCYRCVSFNFNFNFLVLLLFSLFFHTCLVSLSKF